MIKESENTLTIEQIKSDLKSRCSQIPDDVWERFNPDSLSTYLDSPLLQDGPWGHQVIETVLAKDGRIIEKLVYYASDGYDSEKTDPDKDLGETSDERYQEIYQISTAILDSLKQKAV
jgi:hypothetical protein